MDKSRFDDWTVRLSTTFSRRRTLSGLTLGAIGLARGSEESVAGPGCKNVGKKCRKGTECCSGVCKGKRGKKKCKGHDQSTCQAGQDVCGGLEVSCTTTTGQNGECARTTGKASYCVGDGDCFACAKDADCVPFCGPGAACIVCANCLEINGGETLCAGLSEDDCTFPE